MPKLPTPFGHWPSPITPALAAAASHRFGRVKAESGAIFRSQSRPEEGGPQAIFGGPADRSGRGPVAPPLPAPSGLAQYRGGQFWVLGQTVYLRNHGEPQIYSFP